MDCSPARLLCPWGFSWTTRVGCRAPPPGHLPSPGIEHNSPTLQVDSLPAESLYVIINNTGSSVLKEVGIWETMTSNYKNCLWFKVTNRSLEWGTCTCQGARVFVVQLLSCVWLFATPRTVAHHASLSPSVCSNSCLLGQWCHPTISSSITSFSSCPQSFPTSGSFPMSWLFISGSQCIGASV